MKIFIDSSQASFVCFIFNEANQVVQQIKKETKFKVEEIINFFQKCPYFDQIKEIYLNRGPGSFVGSRIALLFVRTWAQIKEVMIYQTNTFDLLSQQYKKIFKKYYINATKQKSYCLTKNKIKLVDKSSNESEINYQDIASNFGKYQNIFIHVLAKDLAPIYASAPQIGGRK